MAKGAKIIVGSHKVPITRGDSGIGNIRLVLHYAIKYLPGTCYASCTEVPVSAGVDNRLCSVTGRCPFLDNYAKRLQTMEYEARVCIHGGGRRNWFNGLVPKGFMASAVAVDRHHGAPSDIGGNRRPDDGRWVCVDVGCLRIRIFKPRKIGVP